MNTASLLNIFNEHLQELRKRIAIAASAVALCSAAAYFFAKPIAEFLIAPLFTACPELHALVYTNLTEAFVSYLKVSLLVGLVAAFPVVISQLWLFVAPGLHQHERRLARTVIFWATFLFFFGVCFAYFAAMPRALAFFMSFVGEEMAAMPKLDAYLSFVVRSALAFGLAFEIPFLMVMAAKAGFVARAYFISKRYYFYGAIVVLSFLLAAGDIMSTMLLVLPLFVLYELGLLVMKIFGVGKEVAEES